MLDIAEPSILPGPKTRDTEGKEHQRAFIPRAEAQNKAWLPWKSNGCEHGDRLHGINPDGTVREVGDRAPAIAPRRRPKAVSSRQYEGRH
jgi:hypothetical protein